MFRKEYLRQISDIQSKIENKKERLERLTHLLTSPGVPSLSPDKVQSSISDDKFERLVIEKSQLEDELQSLMYKEAALIIKIGKQIDEMEKPIHRRILHLRYECGMQLADVAHEVNYDYVYVRTLHGQALMEFQKMYLTQ